MEFGAILQARMGSSRLPGKSMMDLAGAPLIRRVLDRVVRAHHPDGVVVATTTHRRDDVLEAMASEVGVACFRGSEENVLERVVQAAQAHEIEHIVELHGDNPFLDPEIIDAAIERYRATGCDYISNTLEPTYPSGVRVQVFATEKLREVYETVDDPAVIEHVSVYFYEHPEKYRIVNLAAPDDLRRPDIRLTVDTDQDLELARAIYGHLRDRGLIPHFSTRDVIAIIDEHRLAEINAGVRSKPIR